eukprot:gb/GEZN01009075.1/.p1 GENE.gb/GEZN01009075.1/~~gb/GEZN01009075.1/.p1  ORF type:complete len:411 (-),score=50.95 gb/GEZN01009075.1/:129-1316(-)
MANSLSASDFMFGGSEAETTPVKAKNGNPAALASPSSPRDEYAPIGALKPMCEQCNSRMVDVHCITCKMSRCKNCSDSNPHEGHDSQPWTADGSSATSPHKIEKSGSSSQPKYESDEQADALRKFLTTPVKPGAVMQCFVKRNKSGAKGAIFPTYELYDEANKKDPEFLCACKRKLGSKDSNYILSLSKQSFEKDIMFLGKLRGNLKGTEYMIWEGDVTKGGDEGDHLSYDKEDHMLKNEIGCAIYAQQAKLSFLSKVPRKMTLILPRRDVGPDGKEKTYEHKEKHSVLAQEYRKVQVGESKSGGKLQAQNAPLILVNKEPIFNTQVNAYVLDFKGRVSEASVKNFQLVDRNNADVVLLQFGRVGSDKFNMDFRYPLSPMQAFLACITTFDKPAN